ncbi:MAG: hypothetical protein AAF357_19340, partial [Verrucomicrobiota bacterium]
FDHSQKASVIADGDGKILRANTALKVLAQDSGNLLVGQPLTALLDETSCMLIAQHLPAGQETGNSSAFQGTIKRRGLPPLDLTLEICSLSSPGEPITFMLSTGVESNGPTGLPAEQSQHQFRNQLQMVTSLFSIESHDSMQEESLVKWQLRLRSMACAIPTEEPLDLSSLIRQVSDEAAGLLQLGPSERFVSLSGEDEVELSKAQVTPMALLIGELILLVSSHRKPSSTPRLFFSFSREESSTLLLEFLAENLQAADYQESETETIRLLVAQMGGQVSGTAKDSYRGWTFSLPH